MGGSSTSHSAVLGRHKAKSSSAFDLQSWQGLTHVLRVGKESLRDSGEYAEFRNLILEYAQKGGDKELRQKIDTVIATFSHGESIKAQTNQGEKSLEDAKIDASHIQEKQEKHANNSVPAPQNNASIHFIPKSIVVKKNDPPTIHTPQIGTQRIQPRFTTTPGVQQSEKKLHERTSVTSPTATVATTEEKMPEIPEISEIPPQRVSVSPIPPQPAIQEVRPARSAFKSLDEYKSRITEIKRSVNTHVGNPVMLIDTHNDLGKKYMTTLLAALKATGGGGGSDVVEGAMRDLEEIAKELLEKLPKREIPVKAKDPIVETKKETIPVAVKPVILKVQTAQEQISEAKKEEKKDVYMRPTIPVEKKIPREQDEIKNSTAAPVNPILVVEKVPEKEVDKAPVPKQSDQLVKIFSKPLSPPPVREQTMEHEDPVDPTHIVVQQAELSSPEITQSLHQLLHEWNIFGGSGIFGMGPGGSEHPLYLVLAPLSMGEVISGRWEKSDPEIVKVIKEYIDAWRHEQGIAYTINETFEHYLRRVVQRILKRQSS